MNTPNASWFQFPVHSDDIASFEPRLAEYPARLMRMVDEEADRLMKPHNGMTLRDAMATAASRIIDWYQNAPREYNIIRDLGLVEWVVTRHASMTWATLLRAKHDGVNFPL